MAIKHNLEVECLILKKKRTTANGSFRNISNFAQNEEGFYLNISINDCPLQQLFQNKNEEVNE